MIGVQFPTVLSFMVKDRATRELMRVRSAADATRASATGLTASFKNLAGAFTGIMIGRRILGLFQALINRTNEFQMALLRLQSLSGATTKEMHGFRQEIWKVAGITPYGPVEVTDALLKLRRATGSTEGALKSLGTTTQFAMAGMGEISLRQAVETLGQTMRSFGFTAGEIETRANQMAQAARIGGLSIADFTGVMGRMQVAAARGDQTFEDILKMFVLVRRGGLEGKEAVTGLTRIIGEIQTGKAKGAFKELQIEIGEGSGKMRNMLDIMGELAIKYRQATVAGRETMERAFRERSMKTAIIMLRTLADQPELLQKMNTAMRDTTYLQGLSTKYMESFPGLYETFKEEVDKVILALGESLVPVLKASLAVLKPIAAALARIMESKVGSAILGVAAAYMTFKMATWAVLVAKQGLLKILALVNYNLHAGTAAAVASTRAQIAETSATNASAVAYANKARVLGAMAAGRGVGAFESGILPGPGLASALTHREIRGGTRVPGVLGAGAQMGGMWLTGATTPAHLQFPSRGEALWSGAKNVIRRGAKEAVSGIRYAVGAFKAGVAGIVSTMTGPLGLAFGGLIVALLMYKDQIRDAVRESMEYGVLARAGATPGNVKGFMQWMQMGEGTAGPLGLLFHHAAAYQNQALKESKETAKEIGKILTDAGKRFYEGMQLGGKLMNESMGIIDKMLKWEPPVVKWGKMTSMYTGVTAAKRIAAARGTQRDVNVLSTMQRSLDEVYRINAAVRAEGRDMTPEEFNLVANLSARALTTAKQLAVNPMYRGAFSKGRLKGFGKGFVKPMVESVSWESLRANREMIESAQGLAPTGRAIPGYKTEQAGLQAPGPGPLDAVRRFLAEPFQLLMGKEAFTGAEPAGGGAAVYDPRVAAQQRLEGFMADMSKKLEKMARSLAGELRVKVIPEGDKMGKPDLMDMVMEKFF
jgi:TP901 family phage tail tape measure protein